MNDDDLLSYIKVVEQEHTLSPTKKSILCLLLTALQNDPDGLPLSELNTLIKLSRDRMYRILNELVLAGFIERVKKGNFMHIFVRLENIKTLQKKHEVKKNLISQTLKLRSLASENK